VDKDLERYAERATLAAGDIPLNESWQQVVVIPVCNESTEILRALPGKSGRNLMILVVNETENSEQRVSLANQAFAAELKARFTLTWNSDAEAGLSLYRDPASRRDLLLVDRFSEGHRFPPKGGVGHARKTGADLAACLIHRQRIGSPWIHCTDADVYLPPRYFSCSAALDAATVKGTAALIYPFRHLLITDETSTRIPPGHQQQIMQVTRLYEYSLRYYVAGLKFAGSPYAFHTIGSTLAVNAYHYAKVRGFPRRQAGEDFYLLNKLAKVGSVLQLRADTDCEPIDIAARLSDRVPFGTGAAVGKIMQLENPENHFLLYHPSVFVLLHRWLASLPIFWQKRCSDIAEVLTQQLLSEPDGQPAGITSEQLQNLISGLQDSGANKALQHAFRQSAELRQFMQQMHTWFDAFRTLKLVHHLRDHGLPSISCESLLMERDIDHLLKLEASLPQLQQMLRNDYLK